MDTTTKVLLVGGGLGAAWWYFGGGVSTAAAAGTPAANSPLTTDPNAPQVTNYSPVGPGAPGVTTQGGVSTYNSGVVGSGPITNVANGSALPVTSNPKSPCAPGFQLDAAGVCTKYADQLLLSQMNAIPWTGSVDIPDEQIARIDPQILASYKSYPGITPGSLLAYMLGLGTTPPLPNTIANGSDGSAYQFISGVWVRQGTSTNQTNPLQTSSIAVATTAPPPAISIKAVYSGDPKLQFLASGPGKGTLVITNAPPNATVAFNPPGAQSYAADIAVGTTDSSGAVTVPVTGSGTYTQLVDFGPLGHPVESMPVVFAFPIAAATPATAATLNQLLATNASQAAMANASAAAAAVNPYTQIVAAQGCGPQPPAADPGYGAWYNCFYNSQGAVGQAVLGKPALQGVPMNANALHRLRGVIPIGPETLQEASHNPQIAAIVGRDPRAMLTAAQWNYHYAQATGQLQSAQLNPPGFPHALMSAQDYQMARAAHGLPVTLAQSRLGLLRNSAPGSFPLGGISAQPGAGGPFFTSWTTPPNRNIFRVPGRGAVRHLGTIENGGGKHRWARSPFPRQPNWREAE